MCGYDKEMSHTNAIAEFKLNELGASGCVFMRTPTVSANWSLGSMLITLWY